MEEKKRLMKRAGYDDEGNYVDDEPFYDDGDRYDIGVVKELGHILIGREVKRKSYPHNKYKIENRYIMRQDWNHDRDIYAKDVFYLKDLDGRGGEFVEVNLIEEDFEIL